LSQGTVTWSFAAEEFRRRHGFAAVSGTELDLDPGGVPTGAVRRRFDEWDKAGARRLLLRRERHRSRRLHRRRRLGLGYLVDILDLVPRG
jgi:hypothetical protein